MSHNEDFYCLSGKLVLKIPWKNLYTEPVVAEVDGLYLLVRPNTGKNCSVQFYAGGNPAMDLHPIQGEKKYSYSLHATETVIISGLMSLLAHM